MRMMTRLKYELLIWEIKKLEQICRITRKTRKRTRFQSEFQGRLNHFKSESRHHLLVLCFFKGIPYTRVENSCRVPPDLHRIRKLIFDYAKEDIGQYSFRGSLPQEWEDRLRHWMSYRGGEHGKVILSTKN